MKKFFFLSALTITILMLSVGTVHQTGEPQETTQQEEEVVAEEEDEKLPETNIMENAPVLLGVGAIVLAIAIYKIQIDVAKIQQKNFENRVVGSCEK